MIAHLPILKNLVTILSMNLSMYLDVADSSTLPYGWSRYAQFSLAVVNQIHNKYSIRKVIWLSRSHKSQTGSKEYKTRAAVGGGILTVGGCRGLEAAERV
ncbi:unnamed protein product [Linum tenue]|uniref:Uncharacterized protein n=1 Tax=Linum tenue TaxID=586396 RepID=A0AAV0HGR3_9ROSI|nr:unnamed protein product [Linum tenue]